MGIIDNAILDRDTSDAADTPDTLEEAGGFNLLRQRDALKERLGDAFGNAPDNRTYFINSDIGTYSAGRYGDTHPVPYASFGGMSDLITTDARSDNTLPREVDGFGASITGTSGIAGADHELGNGGLTGAHVSYEDSGIQHQPVSQVVVITPSKAEEVQDDSTEKNIEDLKKMAQLMTEQHGKNWVADWRDDGTWSVREVPVKPNQKFNAPPATEDNAEPARLGNLSMKYETGKAPSQYREAAGVVSSGDEDKGGRSYGAYQLASKKGQVAEFLKKNGAAWASQLQGMDPTKAGAFGAQWKKIANDSPEAFFSAQHKFIEDTHYIPVVDYVRDHTGLDIDTQPQAVRDAVWSASVQHGGAKYFIVNAVNAVSANQSNPDYAAALINSIYDKRVSYVSGLDIPNKNSLMNRYSDERRRALNMLSNKPN